MKLRLGLSRGMTLLNNEIVDTSGLLALLLELSLIYKASFEYRSIRWRAMKCVSHSWGFIKLSERPRHEVPRNYLSLFLGLTVIFHM